MKPQGLYTEISHADYHADKIRDVPTLSSSIAHELISSSPKHAWAKHPRLGGQREDSTDAESGGTLLHSLLLGSGPEIVEVQANDFKTKAAQQERDAALEAGKIPVIAHKYQSALAKAEKIAFRLRELGIDVSVGDREVTAVWQEAGTWCRGRLDHFATSTGVITDLKFYESANPGAFARSMISYGTDIHVAAYTSAVEKILPDLAGRVRFQFAVIEKGPASDIGIYTCSGSMRELGRRRWMRAVRSWAACTESGVWPGYGRAEIEAPAWAMAAEDMASLPQGGSPGVTF